MNGGRFPLITSKIHINCNYHNVHREIGYNHCNPLIYYLGRLYLCKYCTLRYLRQDSQQGTQFTTGIQPDTSHKLSGKTFFASLFSCQYKKVINTWPFHNMIPIQINVISLFSLKVKWGSYNCTQGDIDQLTYIHEVYCIIISFNL